MNYYGARKLKDGSGWHFTVRNDDRIWPVGYCAPTEECPDCEGRGFCSDEDFYANRSCLTCHSNGYAVRLGEHIHATEDEARECFRRYLLDGAREESYADWTGCVYKGCDAPTKKGMRARPPLGQSFPLCDGHRDPDTLAELTGLPGSIIASY